MSSSSDALVLLDSWRAKETSLEVVGLAPLPNGKFIENRFFPCVVIETSGNPASVAIKAWSDSDEETFSIDLEDATFLRGDVDAPDAPSELEPGRWVSFLDLRTKEGTRFLFAEIRGSD